MSLKLDVDYLISIKKNVRDKFKAVDGLNELIDACHNRSNVLTANIAKDKDVLKNKEELGTLNESCGILNVLCDILLSREPEDDTKSCERSEPWEKCFGGKYEPERKS